MKRTFEQARTDRPSPISMILTNNSTGRDIKVERRIVSAQ
jgi:hypothetical protein